MLKEIFKFLIEAACLTGLLAYLGRKLIDNSFSKSLERYKTELEKLRYEHHIRYSTLHEARATVIKDLFIKLVRVERSMSSLVAVFELVGPPPKEEKAKIAAKDFNDLVYYFGDNEIYFSDMISGLFNKINSNILDAWYKFMTYPSYKRTPHYFLDADIERIEEAKLKNWTDAWKLMKDDFPPLKKELKKELQLILGIE